MVTSRRTSTTKRRGPLAGSTNPATTTGSCGRGTRSMKGGEEFGRLMEEVAGLAEAGNSAGDVLAAVLDKSKYVAELEGSNDPQDEGRVENLDELVSVAREFEEARPDGTL